jgi:hypothetical protein
LISGKGFYIKCTVGANDADGETVNLSDTNIVKSIELDKHYLIPLLTK